MGTEQIIEEYFSGYAAAVAQSRALVAVEDGLKPSMRMALYANYTDKFCAPKPPAKFIKLIGSATRFCWHGDASTFGMMIRAAKPFAMRYPLYDTDGSYGTVAAPDNHAAARYVGGRLNKLAASMFTFLEKDTIEEWRDNYDNTEKFPQNLPSVGFWNICNGTQGIGVGVASSIPQFNLKEMNQALINMLWERDFDVPMPDFATGGILINTNEVKRSLTETPIPGQPVTGCKLRAKITYNRDKNCFHVTEIPYSVYTNTICDELMKLVEDESSGIDSFNDASTAKPDIEIYLNKKAMPDKVLELLFKKTSLQYTYGINLTMLRDSRRPEVFSLPMAMAAYLDHQIKVFRRAIEFDKKKAEERVHILDGYIIACASIEEVVQLIKTSADKKEAARKLTEQFNLDMIQAEAILKLTLSRIASLEVKKFIKERENLLEFIAECQKKLNDPNLIKKDVESALRETAARFGDERRTQLLNLTDESADKLLYFTSNGQAYLNPPKDKLIVSTLIYGVPYLGVTEDGTVYRSSDFPKRAKQVFKNESPIIGVFPDDESKYLVFLDKEKHFRCKAISTLNKGKTKLFLSDLTFVAVSSEQVNKNNYKKVIFEENKI